MHSYLLKLSSEIVHVLNETAFYFTEHQLLCMHDSLGILRVSVSVSLFHSLCVCVCVCLCACLSVCGVRMQIVCIRMLAVCVRMFGVFIHVCCACVCPLHA